MAKNNKPASGAGQLGEDWDEKAPDSPADSAAESQTPPNTDTKAQTPPASDSQPTDEEAKALAELAAAVADVGDDDPQFPDDLAECFAGLKELERQPVKGKAEAKAKAIFIEKLKQHIHRLQQGLPVIHLTADDHVVGHKNHNRNVTETRWEFLARTNIVAQEMFEEIKSLRAQNAKLKTPVKK